MNVQTPQPILKLNAPLVTTVKGVVLHVFNAQRAIHAHLFTMILNCSVPLDILPPLEPPPVQNVQLVKNVH